MTKKTPVQRKAARKRATARPAEAAARKPVEAANMKKVQRKTARPATQKPAEAPAAFHFDLTTTVPRIVAAKAPRGQPSTEFASFEDAKDRVIDFLIDFIADCERHLWDLKRAESFAAYAALIAAEESQKH